MNERTGQVTMHGKPLTLLGDQVGVGSKAPDFQALDNDLNVKTQADFKGSVVLVVAVPSLDTAVCNIEARRFSAETAAMGEGLKVVTVSMDLPFAQKRWMNEAGITGMVTLSDHRDASFGANWGVLIKELRLLARAVFVVDREGTVRYAQIVPEASNEPDYDAALNAARGLISGA